MRITHLLFKHRRLELIQADTFSQLDRGLLQQTVKVGLQCQLRACSGGKGTTHWGIPREDSVQAIGQSPSGLEDPI